MRVLVVEDNDLLGDALQSGLRQLGFAADWVRDGIAAKLAIESEPYAAVVLDIGLPRLGGLDMLKQLREAGNRVPVLILTARDTVLDRISGLDAGADDYLVKPFDMGELSARLRALIRRASGQPEATLKVGALTLDPAARTVVFHGNQVMLAAREFQLLQILMLNVGKVISREKLMAALYAWDEEIESNVIDVHLHHLRRKLAPELVQTIRGVGFMLPKVPS